MSEPGPETLAAAMEQARLTACGRVGRRCVALPHAAAFSRTHANDGGWLPLGRITDRDGWRSWDAWWHPATGEVRIEPRPG